MREMLITSSVLILAVAVLRRVFRERVPARLLYALWLLVALRLLCPFSLASSELSVMNAAHRDTVVIAAQEGAENMDGQQAAAPAAVAATGGDTRAAAPQAAGARSAASASGLRVAWSLGGVLVGAWFLARNLRFARRLRRCSEPYSGPGTETYPISVRYAPWLSSPCVFGVLRPVIYINDKAVSRETMRCILAHEWAHCRHLDPLWSLVRAVCCAVWWFHPLVWLAAALSRQDSELACDENVLRGMGESERLRYGYMLLASARHSMGEDVLSAAMPFAGGRFGFAERVRRTVRKSHTAAGAVVAIFLACAVLVSCTFTGAKSFSFMEAPCAFYAAEEQPDGSVLLAAQEGTAVYAPEAGTVENADGGTLRIAHKGGVVTELRGLENITAKAGDKVKRGDKVAEIGSESEDNAVVMQLCVYKNSAVQDVWDYIEPYRLFTFSASGEMIRDCGHAVSTVYYNGVSYSDEADALLSLSEAVNSSGYHPVQLANDTTGAWHSHLNLNVFGDPDSVAIYTDEQLQNGILADSDGAYYTGGGMAGGSIALDFSSSGSERFKLYQYAIFPELAAESETFYIDMRWENGDRLIVAVRTAAQE